MRKSPTPRTLQGSVCVTLGSSSRKKHLCEHFVDTRGIHIYREVPPAVCPIKDDQIVRIINNAVTPDELLITVGQAYRDYPKAPAKTRRIWAKAAWRRAEGFPVLEERTRARKLLHEIL